MMCKIAHINMEKYNKNNILKYIVNLKCEI